MLTKSKKQTIQPTVESNTCMSTVNIFKYFVPILESKYLISDYLGLYQLWSENLIEIFTIIIPFFPLNFHENSAQRIRFHEVEL